MKKFSHKKIWHNGAVQIHVDPPPIILIKTKNDAKLKNDGVKKKLFRNPTSEKSDLYEFKMALFYKSDPEYFLSFVHNF